VWLPLALRAARQASGTRELGRGGVAVDRPGPARPGAGKRPTGWRGATHEERRRGTGRGGSGTSRSLAPVLWRTWRCLRAASRAVPCRWGPSWRRRPQAEMVVRHARSRRRVRCARRVRTASLLRRSGRFLSWGGADAGARGPLPWPGALSAQLDAAQRAGPGTARVVRDVRASAAVVTERCRRDVLGGLAVMRRAWADGPARPLLRPVGQASAWQVLDHPLAPWGHGATSWA
jgi:hypothetical protein